MTDNEIIQALRCCAKGLGHDEDECENCKVGEIQNRREYIEFAAANAIERLTTENAALREKVPQWIPVTERLPELGVPVLINYIGTDELPYADGVAAWAEWGALWWEGSLADSEREVSVPITHWMPLPEEPADVYEVTPEEETTQIIDGVCTACGALMDCVDAADYKFCPHCGRQVSR